LDEVQKLPSLFPVLRSIIDRDRQAGRFILLGSAAPDLIRDTSETLAGRIAYFELTPFLFSEVAAVTDFSTHLFRGGFPGSLLAPDDVMAQLWRKNFINTYLERDLPMLGLNAEPTLTSKLWRMVAHLSANVLNMETIASGLGISNTSVRRYLDFFESAFLIRRLQAYAPNLRKRLIRSPKIYLRDTGVLHQLLGIQSFTDLSGHPVVGASWETYVIEQIAGQLPDWAEMNYYRTHDGTEADLVISRSGVAEILVEIKFNTAPKLTKSLHLAKADLATKRNFIICPVGRGFPLAEDVQVLGLGETARLFE
ncbi:MAG: ATP-binding protein, partial [Saprospiraceae bacterium]